MKMWILMCDNISECVMKVMKILLIVMWNINEM